MTRAQWLALAERCQKATRADCELDAAIIRAAYPNIGECSPLCDGDEPIFWHAPYYKQPCPALTASLDAITSLIERELPGWEWSSAMSRGHGRANVWRLSPMSRGSFPPKHCSAVTEPLARCAAFCAAMAERAEA